MVRNRSASEVRRRPPSDGVLRSIGFLSFFDRFGTPPMLLVIVAATDLSLAQAVELVAIYALMYAIGQPIWGLLSDRFGRLTVMRSALTGLLLAALASAAFSAYLPLLIARAVAGFMAGALYPTLLTILGDTRTGVERARALSDLQIYSSMGTTIATLAAGSLAVFIDWRFVFALPALGCLVILVLLRGAVMPGGGAGAARMDVRPAFAPAALGVYALAVLEGAVLVAILTYFVPALQAVGVGVSLAGVLAAGYGVGVILGAQMMRFLVRRFSRTQLMIIGGVVLIVAFLASALWQLPPTLTLSALLVGASNAILHSSVQGWATDVAPKARATSVSLFACSLFLGSSVATFVTAGLAGDGRYQTIFWLGLIASVVLTIAMSSAHAAWRRRHPQH